MEQGNVVERRREFLPNKQGFKRRHLSQNFAIVQAIKESDSDMSELLADVDEGFRDEVRVTEQPTDASRQNMAPLGGPV